MSIKGVIFDLDGLILDTEKLYQRFWREAARKCGFDMSRETALALRSLDKTLARKMLCENFGEGFDFDLVKKTRIELMSAYVDEHGVEAKTGVRELTDHLRRSGIKTAIATATNYERTNDYLTRAGVRDCFELIFCACDLPHGKPYPDVYLYACGKLGLSASECIALEDSPNGVKSAYSAGCKVVCVPDGGVLPLTVPGEFSASAGLSPRRDVLPSVVSDGVLCGEYEAYGGESIEPYVTAWARSLDEVIGIIQNIS